MVTPSAIFTRTRPIRVATGAFDAAARYREMVTRIGDVMLKNRHRGPAVDTASPPRHRIAVVVRPLTLAAALALGAVPALAQGGTTPPEPSAAQPSLPPPSAPNPSVVQTIVGPGQAASNVRGTHPRHVAARRRHHLVRRRDEPLDIDRPALAGVELLRPLPPPGQPPHFVVPTPAYPFENFVTAYTTPPPPLFCHRTRREPDLPDPHLYQERAVVCEPDNP